VSLCECLPTWRAGGAPNRGLAAGLANWYETCLLYTFAFPSVLEPFTRISFVFIHLAFVFRLPFGFAFRHSPLVRRLMAQEKIGPSALESST